MKSHLPQPVLEVVTSIIGRVDNGLQAEAHKVGQAIGVDAAFDHGYIDGGLTRAILCSVVEQVAEPDMRYEHLGNGGCELVHVHEGVQRLFRFKKAVLDDRATLVVRVSTDSILTKTAKAVKREAKEPTIFGDAVEYEYEPATTEQWVLAYIVHPTTRTLSNVWAARPIGILGENSPFRLAFDDVIPISLAPPTPPSFKSQDDDLDLGEDDETEEGIG